MTDQIDRTESRRPRPLADRYATWRALRQPVARGFVTPPEPRSIGMVARGRQLVSGTFVLGGTLAEAPGVSLWDIPAKKPGFTTAAQSFCWLDDLAAAGDSRARSLAQAWALEWIARFGGGKTWAPALTGQRLLRMISHGQMLSAGLKEPQKSLFFSSLSHQAHYLAQRFHTATPGLPRIEALVGLLSAGLLLDGLDDLAQPAIDALSTEAAEVTDASGAIGSRNPDELLDVFIHLTWAAQSLEEAARQVPAPITGALARIAPVLRLLRHADGGLARFHGGGRGLEGRLDLALAASGVRPGSGQGMAMGYARLSGGRTTVIVDATAPPDGAAEATAHASTLALELTSGRRPLIVSCGCGAPFGAEWHRAGRATASHSTLVIEGVSSSRFGQSERLTDRALTLEPLLETTPAGQSVILGHSGWAATHGLQHLRAIELSQDGRVLTGQDMLAARDTAMSARLAEVLERAGPGGIPFSLRFHLHPDVDAQLDLGGTAVSLALRSGELWIFRAEGSGRLSLEPSVYLEKGRLKPRPARQILLSARLVADQAELGWTLAKAQDTPLAIRDLDRDEPPV